jgi:hypothetical protein
LVAVVVAVFQIVFHHHDKLVDDLLHHPIPDRHRQTGALCLATWL